MNLPKTMTRVEENTAPHVNERIRGEAQRRLRTFARADRQTRERRMDELEREWDVERALEAFAAGAVLTGLLFGRLIDRRWYAFPGLVAGFLLQHALQGWCPPLPALRRLGFRTEHEIDDERRALEKLERPRARRSPSAD